MISCSALFQVISNRMEKTVVVSVQLRRWVNKYQMWDQKLRKYTAHDTLDTCNVGDIVKIEPLPRKRSKQKSFLVVEIVEREKIVTESDSPQVATGETAHRTEDFEWRPAWAGLRPEAQQTVQEIQREYQRYYSVSQEAMQLVAGRPEPTASASQEPQQVRSQETA